MVKLSSPWLLTASMAALPKPQATAVPIAIGTAVACGLGSAAIEAVSNHGLDNLTIQVAAAGIAHFILT